MKSKARTFAAHLRQRLIGLLGLVLVALGPGLGTAQCGTDVATDARSGAITATAWLNDPDGSLTPEQALAGVWTPYEGVFSRGYTQSATWLRLRIEPSRAGQAILAEDRRLVLRVEPGHLDEVRVYKTSDLAQPLATLGDTTAPPRGPHRWLAHSVVIPDAAAPFELLLRVRSQGAHISHVQALRWDEARDQDAVAVQQALAFLMFHFAVVLWSAFAWLGRPDRVLSLFILNQLMSMVVTLAHLGLIRLWFVDRLSPTWIDMLSAVSIPMYTLLIVVFHVRLIPDLGARQPEKKWLGWLVLQPALGLLLVVAGFRPLGLQLSVATSLVVMPVMMVVAWRCQDPFSGVARQGRHWSRIYLVGTYTAMAALTLPQVLTILGLFARREPDFNWFLTYSLLSALLMGGLLLYRQIQLERQRLELNRSLAEAQRQEQLQRARAAEQSDLITMLTHELKTPLSVVSLSLFSGDTAPTMRERALRSVSAMRDVIDRCAQIASVDEESDADRSRVFAQPVQLDAVLRESVALQTGAERVDLIVPMPLPTCIIDPQKLRLILSNLLDNALKYSPPGSRVTVWAQAVQRGERMGASVEVANGLGRAGRPDVQHLFEKYHRGALARHRSGSGLGLYLAHRLAARLGGTLALRETDDVRFELWIPCDPVDRAVA